MDKVLDEQARVQDRIDAANAWDLDSQLELAMDALRLPPADADVTTLSGGERRRVALCRLLLQSPDLLLLDEPTNHLDAESVAWLERFLKDYQGTVVAVTHDRYFLDNVAGWILELDRGSGIPWEGNYSSWLEQKQKRLAARREDRDPSGSGRCSASWSGSACRRGRGRRRARRGSTPTRSCSAEDTAQKIEQRRNLHPARSAARRRRRRGARPSQGLRRPAADRRPELHAAARRHRRRDRAERRRQDDALPDDHGPGEAGRRDAPARRDRQARLRRSEPRRAERRTRRVWEEISGGEDEIELGKRKVPSRAYVSWFNFKGRDQQHKVGDALGRRAQPRAPGQAAAQAAATCCCSTSRPTTSTSTRCARSKRRCCSFAGCAVVISHDRWFLDRIATHILAFEGDSQVVWFEGNYQDYEADRHRRLGDCGRSAASDQVQEADTIGSRL